MLDIDGPERYKSSNLYGKGCPRCVVDKDAFCGPLSENRKRTPELAIESYKREEEEMFQEDPPRYIMCADLRMRAIWNSFWSRRSVPISVYDLMSTDLLHEELQGVVKDVLKRFSKSLGRAGFYSVRGSNKLFYDQISEVRHLKAAHFSIIKDTQGRALYVAINPKKSQHVRKLEASTVSREMKLTAGTSMISWVYTASIVAGYGNSASLFYEKNDLHHFRIAMNLLALLLKELETVEVEVSQAWVNRVDNLVEGLHLILEDPHVSGKRSEKMHRMLHITQNFRENGSFKLSNTFHWEKGHLYHSKHVYQASSKSARNSETSGPKLRMLLYSISNLALSIVSKDQVPEMPDAEDENDEEADLGFDPMVFSDEDQLPEKPDAEDEEDANMALEEKAAPESGDSYAIQGGEDSSEDQLPTYAKDDEGNESDRSMSHDENVAEVETDVPHFVDYCKEGSSRLYKKIDDSEHLAKLKVTYDKAIRMIKKWLQLVSKDFSPAKAAELTTPGEWKNVEMYSHLNKSYRLTTRNPINTDPDRSSTGRRSVIYKVGDCVVLTKLHKGEPRFAVIIAFAESTVNITNDPFGKSDTTDEHLRRHFVLLEYLNPKDSSRLSNDCELCGRDADTSYKPSTCREEKEDSADVCKVCVHEDKKETTKYTKLTKDEVDRLDRAGITGGKNLSRVSSDTTVKTTYLKNADHDARMLEFLKRNPGIEKIPHRHYHASGLVSLQESPNIVTKVVMIKDVRAQKLSYFYIKDPLRNM